MLRCVLPLLFLPFAAIAQDSLSEAYSVKILRTLHDTIGYYHPAVQSAEARAAYDEAYKGALAQLQVSIDLPSDSIGLQDFVLAAGALQQHIQCGHLVLSPQRSEEWFKEYKSRRKYFTWLTSDDELILRAPFDVGMDTLAKGTEILSINGRRSIDIVRELAVFRGANDEGYDRAGEAMTALRLISLIDSRYGRKDTMVFEYIEPDSTLVKQLAVDMALPKNEEEEPESKIKLSKKDRKAARKLRNDTLHTNYLSLKLTPDSSAWILEVASFSNKAFKHVNYDKLLKRTFETIAESGKDKLILDLTFNGGGDMVKARNLVRYLVDQPFALTDEVISTSPTANGKGLFGKIGMKVAGGVYKRDGVYHFGLAEKIVKPMKDCFRGDVVAIINEGTFSAGTIVANALMEMDAATVIGAKTGGGRGSLFGGNIREIMLGDPDQFEFAIRVPNWMYKPLNAEPGTVTPNVIIPITKMDLIEGRDVYIEEALEILNAPATR